MDKLISAGKEFLEQQSQDQSSSHAHGSGAPSNQGSGHRRRHDSDDDDGLGKAPHEASRLAGASGSSDLFSKAMSMLGQCKGQIADEDIDEEDARRKYKQTYGDEASKLFDDKASKGKVSADASKESVIQKAGETAMKMYFRSQAQQKHGLMGLTSQFIK